MINFTSSNMQVSPSLKDFIGNIGDKTSKPETKKETEVLKPILQDEVVISKKADKKEKQADNNLIKINREKNYKRAKNFNNPNYRSTKEGMLMEFGMSLATLGISFFCLMKFFPKMMQKSMSNGKGDISSITGGLSGIWEDLTKAMKKDRMALSPEVSEAFDEIKQALLHPESFTDKLGSPKRGIIFYGPPGTGKTTLVRAFAKDIEAKFANLIPANLNNKFHGESEKNIQVAIKHICEQADKNPDKNFVVFIDEIDSLIREDEGLNGGLANKIMNTLKTCLNELLERKNIVFFGATNDKLGNSATSKINAAIADRLRTILIDFPTSEQIAQRITNEANIKKAVSDDFKSTISGAPTCIVRKISDFFAKHKVSFRTIEEVHQKATFISNKKNPGANLTLSDYIEAIGSLRDKIGFTGESFEKLTKELGIDIKK